MTNPSPPTARSTIGSGIRRQAARLWRAIGPVGARRDSGAAPSAHLAMLEDAMQSLGEGVALYGPDDRLVWFNRRFRELRNVNPLSCQIGAHFGDILRSGVACGEAPMPPEGVEAWVRMRLEERRQTTRSKIQYRNGRWLRVTDRRTADGSIISIHSDVTELKAAEAAAEAARQRLERQTATLSTLIENLHVGVSLVDADGRFMALNHAYRELYDLPTELCKAGATFESHIRYLVESGDFADGGDAEARVRAIVERAMRPEPQRLERVRRNGRISEIRRAPLPGGGFVNTYIEVTAARQREAEVNDARARLERQTQLLSTLIENVNAGVILVDADGRFAALNRAYGELWGLPTEVCKVGASFASAMRYLAERGDFPNVDDVETYVARRVAHAISGGPEEHERTRPNGRVVQVRRRPLPGGGFVGTFIDVTEARQREAEISEARVRLEQQAQVFSTLIENLQAGVVLVDAEGRFMALNDAFAAFYELPPGRFKAGDTFESFVRHLADRHDFGDVDTETTVRAVVDRAMSAQPYQVERTRPNGRVVEVRRVPLPAGGFVSTYIDVTDARRRETEINQARAQLEHQAKVLSTLIENTQVGVSLMGADGRFLAFNRLYLSLADIPQGAIKPGDTYESFIHWLVDHGDFAESNADAKAAAQEMIARVHRGQAHEFERTRRNGRTIQIRRAPLPGGGLVTTYIDVTDARRREAEIAEARARLERHAEVLSSLIENLQAGVTLVDANGRFMALNQAYLDLYDIPRGTFKPGDTYEACIRWMVEHGDFADGDDVDATVRRIVERAMRPEPQQLERTRANGRVIDIRRVPLPSGGFVTTYIDVTEARRREADLTEARTRLERQTRELAATMANLQAANAAKSTFLANMSHELRTPLNAILGFAEVMRDAMLGPLDARYRDYAKDVHVSGSYLLRLINDILDTSKIDAGQMQLEREPIDLVELIAECERLVLERARTAGVAIAYEIAPEFPLIAGDRLRLKQALLNLVVNAIKFTPSGGSVRLSANASARDGVEIVIADTGIGMEPKHIARALEPFQQLDNRLARRYEGTGLGLPLAKSLIELHGGKLTIDSAPGKGTTARIWLPSERVLDGSPPAAASKLRSHR